MLFTPGQGILTLLLGISLADIPGKRALEQRMIRQPRILYIVNQLRRGESTAVDLRGRRRGFDHRLRDKDALRDFVTRNIPRSAAWRPRMQRLAPRHNPAAPDPLLWPVSMN